MTNNAMTNNAMTTNATRMKRRRFSGLIVLALLATLLTFGGVDNVSAQEAPGQETKEDKATQDRRGPRGDRGCKPKQKRCQPPTGCGAEYLTDDIAGNRFDAVPSGTVQVVVFYDGVDHGEVEVELGLVDGGSLFIGGEAAGGPIGVFGDQIATRQFAVDQCALSGSYTVSGATPNGVVDGVAIGLLWRDADGGFTMWKSARSHAESRADFVGLWPLGFSRQLFGERTPQITDSFGRELAIAAITGAQLVGNGSHHFTG